MFFIPSGRFYATFRYISTGRGPREVATVCNFPLDMHQEFRDILYPRPIPLRVCRRGEQRRDEINLGQSPPFSFREKETAAFPSFPSPRSPRSNGNRIATKLRDTRNTWLHSLSYSRMRRVRRLITLATIHCVKRK